MRRESLQVSNGDGSQLDSLHLAVCIDHRADLVAHLVGGRRIIPASLQATLDKRFDRECQLKRQPESVRLVCLKSSRQQAKKLLTGASSFLSANDVCYHVGVGDGPPFYAPFSTQIALDGIRKGDEQPYRSFDILLLSICQRAVGISRSDEDGSGEVAQGGGDCSQTVAAIPEAIVGRLVAEDENETDDDGQRRDLCNSFVNIIGIWTAGEGQKSYQSDHHVRSSAERPQYQIHIYRERRPGQ